MAYTQKRLKETLRVFRRAKAAERRQHDSGFPQLERSLRNNYAFRSHGQQPSGPQAARWQQDDSEDDDDDYDPSRKRPPKKHPEKAARPKRKAADLGDGGKERKKLKTVPRESTSDELCGKVSFITFKMASEEGKGLLDSLAEQHNTGLQNRGPSGSKRTLGDASKDTWAWETEIRKTYEELFYEQSEEIDNTGGRALRNRKVPAIELGLKKADLQLRDDEDTESQDVQLLAEQEQSKLDHPTSISRGLPAPAPTPPELARRPLALHSQQHTPEVDVINISPSPSPIPECRPEIISTDWAHPIDFRYVPGTGLLPCHFCSSFMYGIEGLGKRRVTVKRTGDGNKMYEELDDGKRIKDKEPTRMCVLCALDRIYISNCGKHEFKVLPGFDPVKGLPPDTIQRYVDQVIRKKGIEDNKLFHPVCSLCICPAAYRCCTMQTNTKDGRAAAAGKEPQGCGLLICESCEKVLGDHKGVLKMHIMREHLDKMHAKGNRQSLRADIPFLFRGSLLHQAYGRI